MFQIIVAVALLVSQIADLVSTDYAIRRGCVEANPLMRNRGIRYVVKLLIGSLFAIWALVLPATLTNLTILGAIAVAMFTIAFRNFILAWKQR